MQFITGRIGFIGQKGVIKKDNLDFSYLDFVIKKRMNKKPRNIAFRCYGRMVNEILALRLDDKIEVEYFIDSNQSKNNKWYTNLHAKRFEKIIKLKKENNNQLKINRDGEDDTFKKNSFIEKNESEITSG